MDTNSTKIPSTSCMRLIILARTGKNLNDSVMEIWFTTWTSVLLGCALMSPQRWGGSAPVIDPNSLFKKGRDSARVERIDEQGSWTLKTLLERKPGTQVDEPVERLHRSIAYS